MNADLVARITQYLSLGGLFNPEMMDHDAVRDLLIDCRDYLAQPASQPSTEAFPLSALIYSAIMHEGKPKTVAEFEAASRRVVDMLERRASALSAASGAEPVAHICILPTKDAGPTKFFTSPSDPRGFPVYASPVARQPLTEEQVGALYDRHILGITPSPYGAKPYQNVLDFARAIEAAHGIAATPAPRGDSMVRIVTCSKCGILRDRLFRSCAQEGCPDIIPTHPGEKE